MSVSALCLRDDGPQKRWTLRFVEAADCLIFVRVCDLIPRSCGIWPVKGVKPPTLYVLQICLCHRSFPTAAQGRGRGRSFS